MIILLKTDAILLATLLRVCNTVHFTITTLAECVECVAREDESAAVGKDEELGG